MGELKDSDQVIVKGAFNLLVSLRLMITNQVAIF